MKELHILNLGAGVQSTALYLMSTQGRFGVPRFDCAIFADTGEEPQDVYEHLEWLKKQKGPEILTRSTGDRLGDTLLNGSNRRKGENSRGFAAIPAFVRPHQTAAMAPGKVGLTRRQCTKEYKTEVIDRTIRREIMGLAPRERIAGRFFIHQYLGLSAEEGRRVRNNLAVFEKDKKWRKVYFPLWEMGWPRSRVVMYLGQEVPHECLALPAHSVLSTTMPNGSASNAHLSIGNAPAKSMTGCAPAPPPQKTCTGNYTFTARVFPYETPT